VGVPFERYAIAIGFCEATNRLLTSPSQKLYAIAIGFYEA